MLLNKGLILIIYFYKTTISSFFGPCCRFTPSCSSYAIEALHHFGIKKGSQLILKRLIKCHPFHPGGYDPVPEIRNHY